MYCFYYSSNIYYMSISSSTELRFLLQVIKSVPNSFLNNSVINAMFYNMHLLTNVVKFIDVYCNLFEMP